LANWCFLDHILIEFEGGVLRIPFGHYDFSYGGSPITWKAPKEAPKLLKELAQRLPKEIFSKDVLQRFDPYISS